MRANKHSCKTFTRNVYFRKITSKNPATFFSLRKSALPTWQLVWNF